MKPSFRIITTRQINYYFVAIKEQVVKIGLIKEN